MKKIYDTLVAFFSGQSWNEFLAQGTQSGKPEDALNVKQIFQQDNYLYAFGVLLLLSVLGVCYYYFMLNRRNGAGYGYKVKYWWIALLVTSALIALATVLISISTVTRFAALRPLKFSLALGITNLIYGAVLFFFFSFLLKRFSVANRTPF